MSWQSKAALFFLPLWLAGCGFQPLYGKHNTSAPDSKLLAGVKIDTIPGQLGMIFKNQLEDKLNPSGGMPAKPAYRLAVRMDHINVPISVARDGTVSRYNINFNSDYVLYRTADDKPVTSGSLSYITSYNNLTNVYFSTYVSEQDALKRGTTQLAELYRERLATYLDNGAPQDAVIKLPAKNSPIAPDSLLRQQQGNTLNLP